MYLCDDFPDIFDDELDDEVRAQELNLLYVVSTRAMKLLVFNEIVELVIKEIERLARLSARRQEKVIY